MYHEPPSKALCWASLRFRGLTRLDLFQPRLSVREIDEVGHPVPLLKRPEQLQHTNTSTNHRKTYKMTRHTRKRLRRRAMKAGKHVFGANSGKGR